MTNELRLMLLLATVLILTTSAPLSVQATPATPSESMATLPLADILDMKAKIDEAAKPVVHEPPVVATVALLALSGRILDQGIEFEARYELDVLSASGWVELPLLGVNAQTQLLALPVLKRGSLAVVDGKLLFMTEDRGRYRFSVGLLQEATVEGNVSSTSLELPQASVTTCALSFDEGLFKLLNTRVLRRPDGVLVFPENRMLNISWSTQEERPAREVGPKPEIASVVPKAYASSVSTLEGRRITRILYQLRFAGRKEILFTLPPNHVVERAFLNGIAVPLEREDGKLRIDAAPARAGDEAATIELVMRADEGVFHLAGVLTASLPRVSWPVNEITLSLHLPRVFTYSWKGGSLSPASERDMPDFTYEVPLPGKRMVFHQHLVAAQAPHVSLDFAVDLKDQYYCAPR